MKFSIFSIAPRTLFAFIFINSFTGVCLAETSSTAKTSKALPKDASLIENSKDHAPQALYPSESKLLGRLPLLKDDSHVRVEVVSFDTNGSPNYVFSDPGQWNRVVFKGKELEGYEHIIRNANSLLLYNVGSSRAVINWQMHQPYDQILLTDSQFLASSATGEHWAYRAIKDGKGYIISDRGRIELEDGWIPFHLPVFTSQGELTYVITKQLPGNKSLCRLIFKDKIFEHELISQITPTEDGVIFAYMNINSPDTMHYSINGKKFKTDTGLDPNWAGYGLMLGATMVDYYNGVIFAGDSKIAYDLNGKEINPPQRIVEQRRLKKIGSLTTSEGMQDLLEKSGQSFWYSQAEEQLYPAAKSRGGKTAYTKPVRVPFSDGSGNLGGYAISREVVGSSKTWKDLAMVRDLQYVGEKLVFVASKEGKDFIFAGDKVFGPYKQDYYEAVISPIRLSEAKISFALQMNNRLFWMVEDL